MAAAGTALLGSGILRGQPAPIRVAGMPVEIAVAAISAETVRVTALAIEGTGKVPDDGALVRAAERPPIGGRRRRERFDAIRAGNMVVRYTSSPPTIHIDTVAGHAVQRLTLDAERGGASFLLPKGPLLGLGAGGPQFDRKGSTDRMRSGQAGYQLRTHGGRVPLQWLIGTDGWGMYIHHPLGSFDFTGVEGTIVPFGDPLPLDVFVVSSPDPKVILREYARVTGFAELPAEWTFGYMQSHRTLAGPEEVMWVAETFRAKRLPCDALIYLGTEFTPSGWNTRNGEFTWKKENFPDPKKTIDDLHAKHYKVVLHVVIEGRRMDGTVHDSCTPEKGVPSGRDSQERWPDDRNVACYWPYHAPLFDLGVDGFWPDQGDGLDAPSRLRRIRMYWEGSQRYRPDARPFALHRNGYAGMQRYAAFLWSGDVYSTWETLATHVPVAVNAGVSGIPFWGTDIGGFVPTPEYTGELHIRWFQFGTFCPSFRAHGRTWHLRLPWGWNTGKLGPEELRGYTGGAGHPPASELHNPHVEPIVKKYLELRYRMLPYTYTVARECCDTGLPMMRALWIHYPDDPEAIARGDQFLWGRDVLVSPVVRKAATSRRLYLPRGLWFDFWSEEPMQGGREIERMVDLETIPLHVRAGAVVPFGPIKQYVAEPVDAPLSLVVYPGVDGTSTWYRDDGTSFDHKRGEWMRVEMNWRDRDRRLRLRLVPGSRILQPARRVIEVRLAGSQASKRVVFDGSALVVQL